jgi:hypothetical protein
MLRSWPVSLFMVPLCRANPIRVNAWQAALLEWIARSRLRRS